MSKQKKVSPVPAPPPERESMGPSPAMFRDLDRKYLWCPDSNNPTYDRYCDEDFPKTILYNHVTRAYDVIKEKIPPTPLMKSRNCAKFKMDLYLKVETLHRSGSFHERSAVYVLSMLSNKQRQDGIFTASIGNWGMALAYQAQKLKIKTTVVYPGHTIGHLIEKCQRFGATVHLYGDTIEDAKKRAFELIAENNRVGIYINGFDHPQVIAGAGSIGIEIVTQLPEVDAILVPIGGGGLIAGVAVAARNMKQDVKIYGIEPPMSCNFKKAMESKRPYQFETVKGIAASLTIPKAGVNAFQTAVHHIHKMILVEDDWTARAMLYLAEEENLIAEGAGAISLGALMATPNILPELYGKKVVCLITGGNMTLWPISAVMNRAKLVEGRIVAFRMHIGLGQNLEQHKVFRIVKNLGCNIMQFEVERDYLNEDMSLDTRLSIRCETRDLKHACSLRRVLERIFPGLCQFQEEAFKPVKMCSCFPKLMPVFSDEDDL